MPRKFKPEHAARAACVFGLVFAIYPAFQHSNSVVVSAELARSDHDLKAVFRSVSKGASNDAHAANKARKDILLSALDSRAVAFYFQNNGGIKSPARLALLSQISRRSPNYLVAELLAAAEGQDLERLVIAFDRIASLTPSIRDKLFSVAASVLDAPDGTKLLAKRQSRPWFTNFVTTAARQPSRLNQVAAFLNNASISDGEMRRRLLEVVVSQYVANNEIAKAQEFASAFGTFGKFDWNSLDFKSLNRTSNDIALFWRFPNPSAQPIVDMNGHLTFLVSTGFGTQPLAEKVLLFGPGRYRVKAPLKTDGALDDALISWKIQCGAIPIRQVSGIVNNTKNGWKTVELVFDANDQCKGYRLSLLLTAPSLQFDQLEIRITTPTISSEL